MNKSTLGTIIVMAGLALAAYLVYQHYQTVTNTNTVSGGITGALGSIGGNINLNTLAGDLGSLFGGSSGGASTTAD
jgi:hypothetical protein